MEKHLLPQSSKTKIVLKYDVLRSKLTAKEWYVICESEVSSWFFSFFVVVIMACKHRSRDNITHLPRTC